MGGFLKSSTLSTITQFAVVRNKQPRPQDLTWVRFRALRASLPCNNGILGRVRTCLMTLHQP